MLTETEFSDRLYPFACLLNNERLPPGQIHLRAIGLYNQRAKLNLDRTAELFGINTTIPLFILACTTS